MTTLTDVDGSTMTPEQFGERFRSGELEFKGSEWLPLRLTEYRLVLHYGPVVR